MKNTDLYLAKKYVEKSKNAKRREIEFGISFTSYKNMMRAKKCWYTGIELTTPRNGKNIRGTDRTIDRIDSSLGYITGNVVATCHAINQIKGSIENPNSLLSAENIKNMLKKIEKTNKLRRK